jgi:hypothetical protein
MNGQPLPPQRNFGPQGGMPSAPPAPLLGVRTVDVTGQDRARLGLPSAAGAHVIARTRGSAAEKANIPLDAVIVGVNGESVGSPADLSALLARVGAGGTVQLTYFYDHKNVNAKVTLGTMPLGSPMPQGSAWSSGGMSPPGMGASPSGTMPSDIGRMQNPAEPLPMPPQSSYPVAPPTDAQRIEQLERRMHELEQRVKELEDRSARGA